MVMQTNNQIQAQFDRINHELSALHTRRMFLEGQQTRLNLLCQFQQKGVTRPDYAGFQPVSRHPFS